MAKVHSQCSRGHDSFELFSEKDNMSDLLFKQFQCYEKVMGEASVSQNMEELWSVYQPHIQHELAEWKNCVNAGSEFAVARYVHLHEAFCDHSYKHSIHEFLLFIHNSRCNTNEMMATQNVLNEYIRLMLSSNTEVLNYYMRVIRSKCNQN